jgi:hypothetical protein
MDRAYCNVAEPQRDTAVIAPGQLLQQDNAWQLDIKAVTFNKEVWRSEHSPGFQVD